MILPRLNLCVDRIQPYLVHHRELHGYGDEASWWAAIRIDPLPTALELWRQSRHTESLKES